MGARHELLDGVDLTQERDLDTIRRRKPFGRRHWIEIGITALFPLGVLLGYALGLWSGEQSEPTPARNEAAGGQPEAGPALVTTEAPEWREAQHMVEARLASIALDEARQAVGQSLTGSGRVLEAMRIAPAGEEVPVRIESNDGPVRVRVSGREVEPVAEDVYRVRRWEPVQVEFVPAPAGVNRSEYFELIVTPLLELEQYDPYRPPRRH